MMLTRSSLKSLQLILCAACAASTTTADAHTAVIFGASGAVGSEVLRALLHQNAVADTSSTPPPFWKDVFVVGRRELALTPGQQGATTTNVTQVVVPDLTAVDQNKRLREARADACFIAVGAGRPYKDSLHQWHSVDVEMAASMARLCEGMQARYISLLSAVGSEKEPQTFTEAELNNYDGPLGWWGMLVRYYRMKGLAERAVSSVGISSVSIFQPSQIVTEHARYGWLDWTLFKVLPFVDPLLPERYHSVHVRLLGMAMAGDAVEVLRSNQARASEGVTQLTFVDFVRIAGKEFQEQEEVTDETQAKSGKEL